jgi:hypothetical protein
LKVPKSEPAVNWRIVFLKKLLGKLIVLWS